MVCKQVEDISSDTCAHCKKPTMSNSTSQQTTYLSSRKSKKPFTKKLNHIIKSVLIPCYQYQHNHKRKKSTCKSNNNSSSSVATVVVCDYSQEKYCCCACDSSSPSARDSVTIVDGPQQPWIVPSEYHKNISVSSATSSNYWMFRTGWTPQPDPLAFLNSGWCVNCNACVRKDQKQCSFCNTNPLITSEHQSRICDRVENEQVN